MAKPDLVLFDDEQARLWEPFALTRPAGELRFGAHRLVERAERVLGLRCLGHLAADHLADFQEPGARSVLRTDRLPDRDLFFLCSRAVLDGEPAPDAPSPGTLYTIGDRPVGLCLAAGQRPHPEFLARLQEPPGIRQHVAVAGKVLEWVWELILGTPEQLGRDLHGLTARKGTLPDGTHLIGDAPLALGKNVDIEPSVVFDTRAGPIRLGDGVAVRAGTRLAGPSVVDDHSRLLGGSLDTISAGPFSYLHGEVAETVVLGYTNKTHDGYLGHAYLGRWVNLGAMTTNSDLKNNYRPVKLWTPRGVRDTGARKLGCLLGDHAKTGIGLLLSTGTVVGAGANIYGAAMPPRYVPPFSWGEGDRLAEYRLTEFLETARAVMDRRGVELDEGAQRHLERCWRRGRGG